MNKKGSAMDLIFSVVGILMFAIVLLIAYTVWDNVEPQLTEVANDMDSNTTTNAIASGETATGIFDSVFMVALFVVFIIMIILSVLLPASPIWLILYLIITIIGTLLAALMSNIYDEVISTGEFVTTSSAFPMMDLIFNNFPLTIALLGCILMVITYAKLRVGGGIER